MTIEDVKVGDFIQYKNSFLESVAVSGQHDFAFYFREYLTYIYTGKIPNRFQITEIFPNKNFKMLPNPEKLHVDIWGHRCLDRFEPARSVNLFQDTDFAL